MDVTPSKRIFQLGASPGSPLYHHPATNPLALWDIGSIPGPETLSPMLPATGQIENTSCFPLPIHHTLGITHGIQKENMRFEARLPSYLDMNYPKKYSRRTVLRSSTLALAGFPLLVHGQQPTTTSNGVKHASYPSIEPDITSEVVGKSHFDLDRVKELVEVRPELARATWDWGFGDFESAIGAASHVGRRDIVEYLISKGARPNIFTFAMLGAHDLVKSTIEYSPGIQRTLGPHGISLLSHAKTGLRMQDEMTADQVENCNQLIAYLESLGDAGGEQYEEVPEDEKPRYLGDYKYGTEDHQGFSVRLNMRKMLSLGRIGAFGGGLYKIGENLFFYNGAPSTTVSFQFEGEEVVSLTVSEPGSELVAQKVS